MIVRALRAHHRMFIATLLVVAFHLHAGVAAAAPLAKSAIQMDAGNTRQTGETFAYRLAYECASTTGPCLNAEVVDLLPASAEYVGTVPASSAGDVATINVTPNFGGSGRTRVRFVMVTPLPAGNSGDLLINVRFPNGSTPNGTIASNTADAINLGVLPGTYTTPAVDVTAVASLQATLQKTLTTTPANLDLPEAYRLRISNPNNSGTLSLIAIGPVSDSLPPGTVFNGSTPAADCQPGCVGTTPATVTWTSPCAVPLNPGSNCDIAVNVTFPSATYPSGSNVTNSFDATVTPAGGASQALAPADVTHSVTTFVASPGAGFTKNIAAGSAVPTSFNQVFSYDIAPSNSGNVPLDNLVIIDTLPVQMQVASVTTGAYASLSPFALGEGVRVSYEKNTAPGVFTLWGSSPNTTTSTTLTAPPPGLGAGEYITRVRWEYGQAQAGMTATTRPTITGRILTPDNAGSPVAMGTTILNCATLTALYTAGPTNVTRNDCETFVFAVPVPVMLTPANGTLTNDNTPVFSGTATPGHTVTVYVGGSNIGTTTVDAGGNWSLTPAVPLPDGSLLTQAAATNTSGNTSALSSPIVFTVDTTPPPAPVVTSPFNGSATSDNTPVYAGVAEANATVIVSVDGSIAGITTADATGTWSLSPVAPLADGAHTVRAIANDAAGNSSVPSSTNNFTVDTAPPAAPVVATPANGSVINIATPLYSGSAEGSSTVTVVVDGSAVGTTTADVGGGWSLSQPVALSEGTHTVRAMATDAVGNSGPFSSDSTFTVDTSAPAAPVVVAPADGSSTSDNTPTFSGTAEPGSTVSIDVDLLFVFTTTADGAGNWSYVAPVALADMTHTVRARATDAAANTSPDSSTNTFTIDSTAPPAPVALTPSGMISDSTPAYTGTAEAGSSVTVIVDDVATGTTTTDGAGNWVFTQPVALGDGAHTVRATASDALGNTSAPSNTLDFTIDATPPAAPLLIVPANGAVMSDSTPLYSGTAEPLMGLRVTVDESIVATIVADGAGNWAFTQPVALSEGVHTVRVVAIDFVGNTTPSNTNSFTVDTIAPAVPVIVSPAEGATETPGATVSGTAEPGAAIEVELDGSTLATTVDGSGNWMVTPPAPLAVGSHSVRARARDAAGNESAWSSSVAFAVEAIASPLTSIITANPVQTLANGAPVTITVQLRDADGVNLVHSGGVVTLSTTLGTLSSVTDHGDGTYSATLTPGAVAGSAMITGMLNGVPITDDAEVLIGSVEAIPTLSEWSLLALVLMLGGLALRRG